MADFPDDRLAALRAGLDALHETGSPAAKKLDEILRIEDPETMCIEYCQYANDRMWRSQASDVTRYEVVANFVDRCHYYFVCARLSKIVEHGEEIGDFIGALAEVGAGDTVSLLRRLHALLERIPQGAWNTSVVESEVDRLDRELDVDESWRALVRYLHENRTKLATAQ